MLCWRISPPSTTRVRLATWDDSSPDGSSREPACQRCVVSKTGGVAVVDGTSPHPHPSRSGEEFQLWEHRACDSSSRLGVRVFFVGARSPSQHSAANFINEFI